MLMLPADGITDGERESEPLRPKLEYVEEVPLEYPLVGVCRKDAPRDDWLEVLTAESGELE
jgi:hypothetical protein